jgi:hypothetical protein
MLRHSLASPKIVHQKNRRSHKVRSLPGLPFGSFMVTAQCRRTALARLWAELSLSPYRDRSRFPQSIDTPPASKSKGKLSIGCFFSFRSLIENSWTFLPSKRRNDGRRCNRNDNVARPLGNPVLAFRHHPIDHLRSRDGVWGGTFNYTLPICRHDGTRFHLTERARVAARYLYAWRL